MVFIISRAMCKQPSVRKYIDAYPGCVGCPVVKYCGTMIQSTRLCRSYGQQKIVVDEPEDEYIPEDLIGDYDDAMG